MDKKKLYCVLGGIVAGVLLLTAILLLLFLPSNENHFPYENTTYQAVINGQVRTDVAVIEGLRYYAYPLVKESMDPYLWWEETTLHLTVTNGDGMHVFSVAEGEETDLSQVRLYDGTPYLSEAFLQAMYGITPTYVEKNRVSIWLDEGFRLGEITSLRDVLCIRQEPSIKAARVQVVENCRDMVVASVLRQTEDGWLQVVSTTGEVGYVQQSHVAFAENTAYTGVLAGVNQELPGATYGTPEFVTAFANEKISMVWEAVYSYNPDTSAIGEMEGLDVIAPTWFELKDAQGTMSCMASKNYVIWAKAQGYAVWGTVTSCFSDPQVTSDMLHKESVRLQFIRQLVDYAVEYGLDGINVDFENMIEEDKWLFTQFVRELSALCHERGLVVSACCTALSDSSYWSLCYDRPSLSASVDYMCVMLYDQHASGSQVAGSVSQLSWTEESLQSLLRQIPTEKLILGMPFYTRLWTETTNVDGSVSVSSSVLYMEDAKALVVEKGLTPVWDEDSGQYYVSYREDAVIYKLWIEDATSVAARVALVSQYDLAGCAAWRRGFETPDIWPVIAKGLCVQYNVS